MSATGEQGAGTGVTPTPGSDGGVTPPATATGTGVTPTPSAPQDSGGTRDADAGTNGGEDGRDAQISGEHELRQALQSSRAEARRFERELKALQAKEKERADAELSEVERATARAEAAEARVKQMEREGLARQIAAELGIPQLWHRLTGDDARSMRADGARFREELGLGQGALDGGVRGGPSQSATPSMDELIRGGVR